jgi:hypothetical protein
MEALLLCLDVGVLIAVFMWVIRNSAEAGPISGLFRYRAHRSSHSPPAQWIAPRWRASR